MNFKSGGRTQKDKVRNRTSKQIEFVQNKLLSYKNFVDDIRNKVPGKLNILQFVTDWDKKIRPKKTETLSFS